MEKRFLTITLVIFLFFTTSCSLMNSFSSERMPGVDIPIERMNTQARLYAPKEANQFKYGTPLGVVLENLTETPVVLPPDHGVKLFNKQDDKWIPIKNDFEYNSGEITVLPKDQMQYGGVLIDINPAISESQSLTTTLRIVVVGKLEGTSNQQVAAYTDVTLNP